MKLMKVFIMLMTALILVQVSSATAEDKKPLRIARLPIMVQQNKLDYETAVGLEMKIARATIIPFNKTKNIAEFTHSSETQAAFNDIWKKLHANNSKVKMTDAVRLLADKMDADLVVCPILSQYSESVTNDVALANESHLSSAAAAEMIIFDRRTNQIIDEKVSRLFNSSYSKYGTASYLAGVCFDELIRVTDIQYMFRNLGK